MFGLARWRRPSESAATVPAGMRIYAVGDVHGRLDLLRALHQMIAADAGTADGAACYLVYLGDYIDRGPDSRGVIDALLAPPPAGFGAVHLRGNHEAGLLGFLDDLAVGPAWLHYGGLATLESYGIALPESASQVERLTRVQSGLREALAGRHLTFLGGLRSSLTVGGYHFVHAGVRPGLPLDEQADSDRLWIRDAFLHSTEDFGKVVVHGHTISREPEVRPNRIGIDTGAFATGRLTCLVLEGASRRFLSTG